MLTTAPHLCFGISVTFLSENVITYIAVVCAVLQLALHYV